MRTALQTNDWSCDKDFYTKPSISVQCIQLQLVLICWLVRRSIVWEKLIKEITIIESAVRKKHKKHKKRKKRKKRKKAERRQQTETEVIRILGIGQEENDYKNNHLSCNNSEQYYQLLNKNFMYPTMKWMFIIYITEEASRSYLSLRSHRSRLYSGKIFYYSIGTIRSVLIIYIYV